MWLCACAREEVEIQREMIENGYLICYFLPFLARDG